MVFFVLHGNSRWQSTLMTSAGAVEVYQMNFSIECGILLIATKMNYTIFSSLSLSSIHVSCEFDMCRSIWREAFIKKMYKTYRHWLNGQYDFIVNCTVIIVCCGRFDHVMANGTSTYTRNSNCFPTSRLAIAVAVGRRFILFSRSKYTYALMGERGSQQTISIQFYVICHRWYYCFQVDTMRGTVWVTRWFYSTKW